MKNNFNLFLVCLYLFFLPWYSFGLNDEGLMYGKVITKSGNHYVGQIRWEDEEVLWHDIFNSIKTHGKPTKIDITIQEEDPSQESKNTYKWDFLEIWEDKYSGSTHQFTCRFGDIKSITPLGNNTVSIVFKNDYQIKVNGGSNDIGASIQVQDYELGEIKIDWNKIEKIYFFDTPTKVIRKFGNPLYGTIKCNSGYWTGIIQWDNDEHLDVDILDGFENDQKLQIPFSNIKCIRKKECGSEVVKKNGSVILMNGTNDVNCENRGINVLVDKVGTLTIPWKVFQQVCFDHSNTETGQPYRAYPEPRRLSGTITTIDHKKYMGYIVYDKDESWDFEMLEGMMKNVKYNIPFRYIQSISPRNAMASTVNLKNGQSLLLEKLQDVSSKNEGILIYDEEKSEPIYISWGNIFEVIFD